jgi:iron complex transport system substrate-binding protein
MRRMCWLPLLPLLGGCAAASTPDNQGLRIVSTNPCADAILMDLVPHDRIVAISHRSQNPAASSIDLAVAARFRSTAGTAEEVVALKPDLVIFGIFEPATSRTAFARAGIRTLPVSVPATIEAAREQIMEIARAVGEPARGRALVARIDAALKATAARPGSRAVPALLYHDAGLASGITTLDSAMLRHAGFANAGADYGLTFTGYLPLERIVAYPPEVLLAPPAEDSSGDEHRMREMRFRAVAAAGGKTLVTSYSEKLSWCAGPVLIPALHRLAAIRRSIRS